MTDHQIILKWDSQESSITVVHVNRPTKDKAAIGDTITFKADPPAQVSVKFENDSNFSSSATFIISDSLPHRVTRLGDFHFKCAVIAQGRLLQWDAGGSTDHPGPLN